jgi:hypothetical protein
LIYVVVVHLFMVSATGVHGSFRANVGMVAKALAILILLATWPAACNPSARPERAYPATERVPEGFVGRLTAFKHVSVIAGPSPGPITVMLSSTAVAQLVDIAGSLPEMAPVMCHENELLYVLTFYPKGRRTPLYQFRGWRCDGEVQWD